MPDIKTLYYKQNVRLQGAVCPQKCQLDQIHNSRLPTFINFNMHNIWEIMPDSLAITVLYRTIEQNRRFRGGISLILSSTDRVGPKLPP